MRTLSAAELLEVWERGMRQNPQERALTLLAACGAEAAESCALLSLGERDRRLAALYERLFGRELRAFAECPRCAERLEYSIPTGRWVAAPEAGAEQKLELASGDLRLRLRLPNTLDLLAAGGCADVELARRALAGRCVLEAVRDGEPVMADGLPDAVVDEIALRLGEADPCGETLLELTCVVCGHGWQVTLEIETFLWSKVCSLSRRLLREVHILAQAYGWREAEILGLSAVRRQSYLEMAGA